MSIHELNLEGRPVNVECKEIMGIDLGTTNSAVAIYNAGTVPTLLPVGGLNKFTVQSCVRWDGFDENGKPVFTVGEEAYKERYKPSVIYSVKRMMGSGRNVTLTLRSVPPYPEVGDPKWDPQLDLSISPAQVSAIVLDHIAKKVAELYAPINRCVITVPAYFDQRQIEDTLKAAEIAGLECLQILKEPTSASYIYSQLGYAQNGSVLIYDLGGGTFDVTHMTFLRRDAVPKTLLTSLKRQYGVSLGDASGADNTDQYFCRVLGTYGDVHLGGDDIDRRLAEIVLKKYGILLSDEGREKLYLQCENFKKMNVAAIDIEVDGFTIHMSSSDLDQAVDDIFAKTVALMKDIDLRDVKSIVLVGGSTKSVRLCEDLQRTFPGVEISKVLDPDATVALGAGAVAKSIASNSGLAYADVLPLPIGILVNEKEVKTCVARNTSLPHMNVQVFRTLHDNQDRITLHVYQGLSTSPSKCTYLGRLTIEDIPKAKAGEVEATVKFVLNGQGRLRIISTVEGIDRNVELVIDNIFSVKSQNTQPDGFKQSEGFAPADEFENSFYVLVKDKAGAEELFNRRRELISNNQDATAVEDEIVSLLGIE